MHSYQFKTDLVNLCDRIEANSEKAFPEFLNNRGWSFCGKSTQKQDMFDHIDCFVKDENGNKLSVDIKGLKRGVTDEKVLIEICNVQGRKGWALGKADLIAFQISPIEFLLVERNKIFQLLKNKMGLSVFTKGGFKVLIEKGRKSFDKRCLAPNWYAREDRPKERITNLTLDEIKKISLVLS